MAHPDGWSVYAPEFSKHRQGEPKTPRKVARKIHLPPRRRRSDDRPASLYLGSGNLTERGIIDPMSPHGNLEAERCRSPGSSARMAGKQKHSGAN